MSGDVTALKLFLDGGGNLYLNSMTAAGDLHTLDSAFMAVKRAGDRAKGAVMASDAFFPMPDGLEVATDVGVTAIIQPGGSKGDEPVVEAADKADAAMIMTGVRHFKH